MYEEEEIEINTYQELPSYNLDQEELIQNFQLNVKTMTTFCNLPYFNDSMNISIEQNSQVEQDSSIEYKSYQTIIRGKNQILRKFKKMAIQRENEMLYIIKRIKKLKLI